VRPGHARAPARGFTLIELLLVLMLIALVSGLVSLSLRDGGQASLDREAQRLAALLEAGRAEARATGVAVRFELVGTADRSNDADARFRFIGLAPDSLPGSGRAAGRWLDAEVVASIHNATALRLGPEPLIGAQRITLQLDGQQRVLSTDGLAPFSVAEPAATTP
jgi:general secretion pathway protein H